MMKRRSFLALLGIGSVSAPLAAKQMAEQEALKLTSITGRALASGGSVGLPGVPIDWDPAAQEQAYIKMGDHVRLFGLPKFVDQSARQRSKYISHLDVDIASKRSWSLAVKVQHQRQRNYEQLVEQYTSAGWYERAQKAFSDAFGFKWQW